MSTTTSSPVRLRVVTGLTVVVSQGLGHTADCKSHVKQYKREAAALEAANWFVRLKDDRVSPHDLACYLTWLKTSPVHVAEMLRVNRIHEVLRAPLGPLCLH